MQLMIQSGLRFGCGNKVLKALLSKAQSLVCLPYIAERLTFLYFLQYKV